MEINLSEISEEILDNIPIAISMQTANRELIYENKAMKELFKDTQRVYCYERWEDDDGNTRTTPCVICPAHIMLVDGKEHSVIRQAVLPSGDMINAEVRHIPLLNERGDVERYIEIITPVTVTDAERIKLVTNFEDVEADIRFIFVRFGDLGGEKVAGDDLPFHSSYSDPTMLNVLSAFWITALGQGEAMNEGLYGPLPVLDFHEYNSLAYSMVKKSDNADFRFKGNDYVMLLIVMKHYEVHLFDQRLEISGFFKNFFARFDKVEDITDDDIRDLKREFLPYLKLLNQS